MWGGKQTDAVYGRKYEDGKEWKQQKPRNDAILTWRRYQEVEKKKKKKKKKTWKDSEIRVEEEGSN